MARVRKAHPVRPSSHATCERIERRATASRATLGAVRASRGSSARARSRGKPERGGKGVLESSGARARVLGVTERPRRAQSDSSKRKKIRGKTKVRCRPCGDSVGSRVSRISRIDGLIDGLIDSRLHARSGPLLSAKISRTTLLARTQITSERTLSTPSSARQAWRASAVPRLRRPRWSDRLVARAPARAGASAPRPRSARARPWAASSSRRLAANPPPRRSGRWRPRARRSRTAPPPPRPSAPGRTPSRRRTSTGGSCRRGTTSSRSTVASSTTSSRPSSRTGASSRRTSATRRRSCSSPSSAERRPADTPSSARGRTWRCVSAPPRRRAPPGSRLAEPREPAPVIYPPARGREREAEIDRAIDRASRRLRSRRLGVFHCPTDLPAAAPASRPATRATHRRPLFVPRPLPSPRSPPRR